jgi:hypothetical protein
MNRTKRREQGAQVEITAGRVVIPAQAGIHRPIKALLDARIRGHDRKIAPADSPSL